MWHQKLISLSNPSCGPYNIHEPEAKKAYNLSTPTGALYATTGPAMATTFCFFTQPNLTVSQKSLWIAATVSTQQKASQVTCQSKPSSPDVFAVRDQLSTRRISHVRRLLESLGLKCVKNLLHTPIISQIPNCFHFLELLSGQYISSPWWFSKRL